MSDLYSPPLCKWISIELDSPPTRLMVWYWSLVRSGDLYIGELGLVGGDSLYWVNSDLDTGDCYAVSPARWSEGVSLVSCQEQLWTACERHGLYPPPSPPTPRILPQTPLSHNSLLPISRGRIRPFRPRRRLFRRRRPYRTRFNFIANPYFAFWQIFQWKNIDNVEKSIEELFRYFFWFVPDLSPKF